MTVTWSDVAVLWAYILPFLIASALVIVAAAWLMAKLEARG